VERLGHIGPCPDDPEADQAASREEIKECLSSGGIASRYQDID
jgi:hypothetical protein